jgi:uncharacterized OsmC-like protein
MTANAAVRQTATKLNGVDVDALFATIEAIKANPAIASFQFRASNRWIAADANRTTIGAFTGAGGEQRTDGTAFEADNGEPVVLLGADRAPNPVEWLLHALVGCMTTTLVYHAAAQGIAVRSVASTIEGDLDLRGFLGLTKAIRPGYSVIRVTMRAGADADAATLKKLAQMSPVFDVVSHSVPVELTIEKL